MPPSLQRPARLRTSSCETTRNQGQTGACVMKPPRGARLHVTRPFLARTSAERREVCEGHTRWRPAACAHPEAAPLPPALPSWPGAARHSSALEGPLSLLSASKIRRGGGNSGRTGLTGSAPRATLLEPGEAGRETVRRETVRRETVRRGPRSEQRGQHHGPPTAPHRSRTRSPPPPPLSHGRPEGRGRAGPGGGHWLRASRRRPMGEAGTARGGGGRRAAAGVLCAALPGRRRPARGG